MLNLSQLWKKLLYACILGAIVFISLSFYANFSELRQALSEFSLWYIPLLLALASCNYIVRFFKWDYFLGALDIHLTKPQSLSIFLAGLIMSISPGKFGEVLKSFLVKSVNQTPISKSAPIVVAERLTDFMGLGILVTLGFSSSRASIEVFLVSVVIVGILLTIIASPRLSMKLISVVEILIRRFCGDAATDSGESSAADELSKIARLKQSLTSFPEKLRISLESITSLLTFRRLVWTTSLSVLSWAFEGFAFYFLLQGYGFVFPLTKVLFIYSFSIILGAVTMLPGGVGLTETSLSGLLILNGLTKSVAVAVTLIIRIATLWFAVALGAVMLTIFVHRYGTGSETVATAGQSPADHRRGETAP